MLRSRQYRNRKAFSLIWTAAVLVLLLGMLGLAVDGGWVMLSVHQLQNAADAAALAAARQVQEDPAVTRQVAMDIAHANRAAADAVLLADNPSNDPAGDIVIGRYTRPTRAFVPTLDSSRNAVKIVPRRMEGAAGGAVATFFGAIFGKPSADISRFAIARIAGSTGSGLLVLNENDKWTFRMSGNIRLDVLDVIDPDGAAVQVNSTDSDAMKFDGTSGLIHAKEINVYADTGQPPPRQVYSGDTNFGQPRIFDPLAGLTPPPTGADLGTVKVTGESRTLTPGYYSGGITMTGGAITCQPGVYVLAGEGLEITGGNLTARGVMFYILPGKKSDVKLTGNGKIDIQPAPLDQAPYGGIALWQSADNTNPAAIKGTNQFSGIDGTVYFPTAHLDFTGTSDSFEFSQVITNTIAVSGNGSLLIRYDGRYRAFGFEVTLVE